MVVVTLYQFWACLTFKRTGIFCFFLFKVLSYHVRSLVFVLVRPCRERGALKLHGKRGLAFAPSHLPLALQLLPERHWSCK